MNPFANKIYWMLLPFAIFIGLFFIMVFPTNGFTYAFLSTIVFWIVYYIWTYITKKRNESV